MRDVSRMEGMRPFCANLRTVDSLTWRIAASWRAVKNSSRVWRSLWGGKSLNGFHPAGALFTWPEAEVLCYNAPGRPHQRLS